MLCLDVLPDQSLIQDKIKNMLYKHFLETCCCTFFGDILLRMLHAQLLDYFHHALDVLRPDSTTPSNDGCTKLLPLLCMCCICFWSDYLICIIVSCTYTHTLSNKQSMLLKRGSSTMLSVRQEHVNKDKHLQFSPSGTTMPGVVPPPSHSVVLVLKPFADAPTCT